MQLWGEKSLSEKARLIGGRPVLRAGHWRTVWQALPLQQITAARFQSHASRPQSGGSMQMCEAQRAHRRQLGLQQVVVAALVVQLFSGEW